MKKNRQTSTCFLTLILMLLLFSGGPIFGQAPATFNYQAVLRDADGTVKAKQSVNIQISLIQGIATEVYTELHTEETNDFGLINLEIGSKNSAAFSLIDWSNGPYYIKISVNGIEMGTTQLLSVPYALYAASGPSIVLGDNSVSSENIVDNTITDADIGPDAVGASELSLDVFTGWDQNASDDFSGNYNDLTNKPSSFDDADADPANELQNISLSGNTLSLSRSGGSVDLPTGGSSWTDNGSEYTYSNRNIGINTSTPGTDFEIYNSAGTVQMGHNSIVINSGTGDKKVELTTLAGFPGWIGTYGPNTSTNTVLGFVSGSTNNGSIGVLDQNSNFVAGMQVSSLGVGVLEAEGPNGNLNFLVTALSGYPNNGVAAVYDENNNWQARMYVNSSAQGVIDADIKNFRMAHPNIPGIDIVYTCVEGPEVAAYVRGTATLSNGNAVIEFPEHFQIVASEISLTVQITPLSADSQGLAVTEKNSNGFEVKELFNGIGNYSFDWEAKCIRKGYEDFKVLQKNDEMLENMPEATKESLD
jgi:hypothetical protein